MSECKLDHTPEDVQTKFEQQRDFLPEEMKALFQAFFQQEHTQDILNEVFHLLKNLILLLKKNEQSVLTDFTLY